MAKSSTPLDVNEIKRLLASSDATKKAKEEHNRQAVSSWPGPYNLRLLAESVNKRHSVVTFDTGKLFNIRYDDKRKWVFIRPSDSKAFVPCGYFSYEMLKGMMTDGA